MPRCLTKLGNFIWVLCLTAMLVSCAPPANAPAVQQAGKATATLVPVPLFTATPQQERPRPENLKEAPGITGLVNVGSLPPLEERLPENPKVVKPVDRSGIYGGVWRMVIKPGGGEELFVRTVAYEPLVRWTTDWAGIEPNLAEQYEVNDDYTEFTFTLRRGVRWSDGEPFTTADIRFWYEDVFLNKDLTPYPPYWLTANGQPAVFEFVDDFTFRVRFESAKSLFLEQLATPDGLVLTSFPAHYARNFHKKYVDEIKLWRMTTESRDNSWTEMFNHRVGLNSLSPGMYSDPDRPRLTAWIPQTPSLRDRVSIIWKRNPFYWKVDTRGNQLPYLDYVIFEQAESSDGVMSAAMSGRISMQNLGLIGNEVYQTLSKREANRIYKFYKLENERSNVLAISFNLAHEDPIKRRIFESTDFRIALSYAINRQEIIDHIFNGQGEPWQVAPRASSPFYDAVLAKQFTEYNLEKAETYLDQAGFRKDNLGRRLGPYGQPIAFTLLGRSDDPQQINMLNMIAVHWGKIGLDVHVQAEDPVAFAATVRSNLHDAAAAEGQGTSFMDLLLDPSGFVPMSDKTFWGIPWANQFNGVPGFEDVPFSNAASKTLESFVQVQKTSNRVLQASSIKTLLLFARQNFTMIGITTGPPRYGIVLRSFINVPNHMPSSWVYPDPGPANPEQFFIDPSVQ